MASSTAALIRASQPSHWLTLNAFPAPKYRSALTALGVKGVGKMSKADMCRTLRTFPKNDVLRLLDCQSLRNGS